MNEYLNPGPQRRVSRELAWASLFFLFTFVSRAEPSLALSPASGSPGETVSIPLSLENSAGSQLGGLMWTLNYPNIQRLGDQCNGRIGADRRLEAGLALPAPDRSAASQPESIKTSLPTA